MMGRWPGDHPKAGQPLAEVLGPDPLSNDFHFDTDQEGKLCPFHAHIQARQSTGPDTRKQVRRPPRFLRRGMTYGPLPLRARKER